MAVAVGIRVRELRGVVRALGQRMHHGLARTTAGAAAAAHHVRASSSQNCGELRLSMLQLGRPAPGLEGVRFRYGWQHPRFASTSANPQACNVDAWTDTPYLEFIVGLEPEGSTPATSTGGSVLAGVRGDKRPHPGYTARLIRLRIENGASVKAREAILDEKSYMRDFGRFWIPMVMDLLGGAHHHYSLEIFAWMKDHPTVLKSARRLELERLYSMMISYAGVVGKMKLARNWFDDFLEKGMKKSSQCCNALIIAYARNNDIESAIAVFNGMKEYYRECPPTAMTFYILITMYARVKDWRRMEEMIKTSQEAGFTLDAITYTTLLHAYGKMGRLDMFERTYQEMQQRCCKAGETFKPNEETWAALLLGYSRLNVPDRLQQTFTEVQDAEVKMAETLAGPIVEEMAKAFCRNDRLDGLEKLLQIVESTPEITSSSAFQSYVLEAYAKASKLDEIEAYIGKLCEKKGPFVEPPAFETAVRAFSKQGQTEPETKAFERLYDIYSKVKQAGYALSPSTYEALVVELAKGESCDKMERVAADMEAAGTKWAAKILRVLYDAYEKAGNSAKLTEISERLKESLDDQEAVKVAASC